MVAIWVTSVSLHSSSLQAFSLKHSRTQAMASGLVTGNFEEKYDMASARNHMDILQQKMRQQLVSRGTTYTGEELDGRLYLNGERTLVVTNKGPLLAKFESPCPEIEVRHEIKKLEGNGKSSLAGKHKTTLHWFGTGATLYVDPVSGRGDQGQVGWSEYGVDYGKSGSIQTTLTEWLPGMGYNEVDPVVMGGLLDALSGKQDYTMLFIKASLILRTLSVAYSVNESELEGPEELPSVQVGTKRAKIGAIGKSECTVDLDAFTDREALMLMLSSMQYPSIECTVLGEICVYSMISMPACSVDFVASYDRELVNTIPTPERWWKAMVSTACKLGAIEDLINAFRISRGWGSWLHGLELLGKKEFCMTLDVRPTRGCRSVLIDSNLGRVDDVTAPTNLVCSMSELLCDWAVGQEMLNCLFFVCDEFGLGNPMLCRDPTGGHGSNAGEALMREAGFYHLGRGNSFYAAVSKHLSIGAEFLGDTHIKRLLQDIGQRISKCSDPRGAAMRARLREVKKLTFTHYFGRIWSENVTRFIGEVGVINSSTWGGTAKSRSKVYDLRNWLDVVGLSDEVLLLSGLNSLQKTGIDNLVPKVMNNIQGAHGKYYELYREVNWLTDYEPRLGSETLEKERLKFLSTYLGMEGKEKEESEDEDFLAQFGQKSEEATPLNFKPDLPKGSFRGSLKADRVPGEKMVNGEKLVEKEEDSADDVLKPSKPLRFRDNSDSGDDDKDATNRIGRKKDDESGRKKATPPPDGGGKGKTDGGGDGNDEKEKPVTKTRTKPQRRDKFSYSAKGLGGWLRSVTGPDNTFGVTRVPGDGLCFAHAIYECLKDKGADVTREDVIKWCRIEQNRPDWFEGGWGSNLVDELGYGLVVCDNKSGMNSSYFTEDRSPEDIIGIYRINNNHFDAIIPGKGDYKGEAQGRTWRGDAYVYGPMCKNYLLTGGGVLLTDLTEDMEVDNEGTIFQTKRDAEGNPIEKIVLKPAPKWTRQPNKNEPSISDFYDRMGPEEKLEQKKLWKVNKHLDRFAKGGQAYGKWDKKKRGIRWGKKPTVLIEDLSKSETTDKEKQKDEKKEK
uniref:OTU domain-containing protein n=1 Tax=Zea mays chrysovirus 1 TaxID=2382121 RepID=A0A386JUE1_9VIRU|nr:hypothetical protein [Zea mays chrysovirus 1]